LFASGLEASAQNETFHNIWFNVKYWLLFEGTLGVFCSAFSLINEAFVSGKRRILLSAIGSCFLIFQGLHILELGVVTSSVGGWQIAIAFGIPISILSFLGLAFNDIFASVTSR
jgi:hypothetical protein